MPAIQPHKNRDLELSGVLVYASQSRSKENKTSGVGRLFVPKKNSIISPGCDLSSLLYLETDHLIGDFFTALSRQRD